MSSKPKQVVAVGCGLPEGWGETVVPCRLSELTEARDKGGSLGRMVSTSFSSQKKDLSHVRSASHS